MMIERTRLTNFLRAKTRLTVTLVVIEVSLLTPDMQMNCVAVFKAMYNHCSGISRFCKKYDLKIKSPRSVLGNHRSKAKERDIGLEALYRVTLAKISL